MALTTTQQQAFDRAKNRVAESALEFDRTYFGEPFKFKFLPTMSQPAMEVVARVQGLAQAQENMTVLFTAITDFMDLMAMDDTGELIGELGRAGIMTVRDLIELQQAVVQAVAARPTERSSSSGTGSSPTGPALMASAPTGTSTQAPWPSTDS